MANAYKNNVIRVDTNADFDFNMAISGVKIVGGSAESSVTIKEGGSSGTTLYESTVASDAENYDEVAIQINKGETPRVEVSGTGAVAYVYLR